MSEHCEWTQKILKRNLVWKGQRHVIKSDSETDVAVGGGSGCTGGDDGNGEET